MTKFIITIILLSHSLSFSEQIDYLKIIKKTSKGYYATYHSVGKTDFSCLFENQPLSIVDESHNNAKLEEGDVLEGKLLCKSPLNDGNTQCGFFSINIDDNKEYTVYSKHINEMHVWDYCSSNVGKANFQNYSK